MTRSPLRLEPALFFLALTCLLSPGDPPAARAETEAWPVEMHRLIAARDFAAALARAEEELAADPENLEARTWRARLLAWCDRRAESEAEYRRVLAVAPPDADVLLGLANVLGAEERYAEAFELLQRAAALAPSYVDVYNARGRMLRALGRRADAHAAFAQALTLDPLNADALGGLDSVAPPPAHVLLVGSEFDSFNDPSPDAQGLSLELRTDLSPRWTCAVSSRLDRRGGVDAARLLGSMTCRPTSHQAITVGGGGGRHGGVVPKGEAFLEYGHGYMASQTGFVRGIEASWNQRWLWYETAQILTLTPSLLVYWRAQWTGFLSVTAAHSRFPGVGAEWRPAGSSRLTIPLARRLTGSLSFAVGTENYAEREQIGRFSARTFGGGLKIELTPGQDLSGTIAYQNRAQGRAQTSMGIGYAVRF